MHLGLCRVVYDDNVAHILKGEQFFIRLDTSYLKYVYS